MPIDLPPLVHPFGIGGSIEWNPGYYPLMRINSGFANVYKLSVSSGRTFNESDFSGRENSAKLSPVLLGSDYARYYKLGDIIENKYEVVGILDDAAFFLDPGKSGSIYYLKHYILEPAVIDAGFDSTALYSFLAFGTYFVNDEKTLAQLESKAIELKLFDDLEFISYSDQLDNIIGDYMLYVYIGMAISSLVLLFCIACSVASMFNYIDSHMRELTIHLIVGAKNRNLITRIAIPPAAVLLLSNIIVAIVFKRLDIVLATVAFSCILLFALMLLPALKISRKSCTTL